VQLPEDPFCVHVFVSLPIGFPPAQEIAEMSYWKQGIGLGLEVFE
jgi:hypothetical protein